ncbi:hypothetical protein [Moraxella lacunata]
MRFLSFFIANTKGRHALTKIKTSHDRRAIMAYLLFRLWLGSLAGIVI